MPPKTKMTIRDLLFGKPLATSMERAEQLGTVAGVPIFGLDALSSAAYGPEAALTLLIPLGAAGLAYILPISFSIIVLLVIVYFSYRQTIAAYPGGGGSYTVASENLGVFPGLLAASALMIDYVLTVAVGISAGVGALVSAAPSLLSHTLGICLAILLLITIINLRGLRQAGIIFMVPTYLFVLSLLVAIGYGIFKSVAAGGHPHAIVAPPPPATHAVQAVTVWLILQAFASGCTAMTGVEAVSNGVRAFREPTVRSAQRTLTLIIGLLIVMLAGIAYLVRAYHITATDPGAAGYQSVLSMIVVAVAGRGAFYYVAIGSVLVVLSLSANTAFADFPRLCRAISLNGYLPDGFNMRGRRLVYSQGVYVLAFLSGALLIAFGGVTDRLIPLYAVGAFLAFTLSQAGMVSHWRRVKGPGWRRSMIVNGVGAVATGITVCVVLVAKFTHGAWITVLLIPSLLGLMLYVHKRTERVAQLVASDAALDATSLQSPCVIVPIRDWGRIAQNAIRFALTISKDIEVLHIVGEDDKTARELEQNWPTLVEAPAKQNGLPAPKLCTVESPYRMVVTPIMDHILQVARQNPNRRIAVVIPENVQRHWYNYLFQNNRASALKALLLLKGNEQIVVINVPIYLDL
ncbi:MAG: APC family permease [Candidatus Acidiferrales bacterium]